MNFESNEKNPAPKKLEEGLEGEEAPAILIAEDDPTSRAMLSAMLEKSGYRVEACVNGCEAWARLLAADAPKLAVLDWVMPEMDGIEVVRRLHARSDELGPLYLIILTSKSDKADIVAGLEAGADDYLAKPFDLGELNARIRVGLRVLAMQRKISRQVEELRKALEHIKTLQGIIPICSYCKKIRDDQGYWSQVEVYISKHSKADFSHGICPDCLQKHFGDFLKDEDDKNHEK